MMPAMNLLEEFMTIYWPWPLTPGICDLLFALHKRAMKVVSYEDQVEPEDRKEMVQFLLTHKDPDEFVYVGSMTHVAAAILERIPVGWAEFDDEGNIITVSHYEFDPTRVPNQRFVQVMGMTRTIRNAQTAPYLM